MLVVWEGSNAGTGHRGRCRLQSNRPRKGKGSNAGTGPKGDRGGSNVTILLLGGSKSQDGEKPGGEVWTARKASLSGTPERSNPSRELVKRKPSSDGRRRIRKWDRQLSQASEERQVRKHQPDRPGFGNRLRTGEGFRMRRLAGGERSTRFEPASQHSQLPHLRTRGPPSKSTIDDCVHEGIHQAVFSTFSLTPNPMHGARPFLLHEPTHRTVRWSTIQVPRQILVMSFLSHAHSWQSSQPCHIRCDRSMLSRA